MHILITGATGFLGHRTTEAFCQKTACSQIIATGRTLRPDKTVTNLKVRYILGDLADPDFVRSLFLQKIDVVVNCASLSSPWGTKDEFEKANVCTQKLLLQQAKKHQIQRFIYISSPSIYFKFEDSFNSTESDALPTKLVNHYAKSKVEAEKLLPDSGLEYVILRPRALIGRGDTVIMPRLIRSYQAGKLSIMGNAKNMVDMTSVANMVDAVWLAVKVSKTNCNTDYNITNGEPVNLWESINYVLNGIGFAPIKKKINTKVLYAVATLMEWKARLGFSKAEPTLTRYAVGVLSNSCTFDIGKAKTGLGYVPKQSTKEAMDEFVLWYRSSLENEPKIPKQ